MNKANSLRPSVSVIVPTYREAENLPHLITRLDQVRREHALDMELIVMDDNSRDGTEELFAARTERWLRLVVRTSDRGLSSAVTEGLGLARNDVIVVMDADLSHPPEKIPLMLEALAQGADFVIGSRYVKGGSTDATWGLFRWLNSKAATVLARPFTSAKDPMSGFFALRRELCEGAWLNAVGYKIGLELLVKCRCRKVVEIPIHFSDRTLGQSKLNLREQLLYLQHLRRLFLFKYDNWAHLAQFLVVGVSGTMVNLAVFTVLLHFSIGFDAAVAAGILVSLLTNFVLNRRFSFSYARRSSVWRQLLGFIAASSVGMVVNYLVAVRLLYWWKTMPFPQMAVLIGIAAGTLFNFMISRFVVFKGGHRPGHTPLPGGPPETPH